MLYLISFFFGRFFFCFALFLFHWMCLAEYKSSNIYIYIATRIVWLLLLLLVQLRKCRNDHKVTRPIKTISLYYFILVLLFTFIIFSVVVISCAVSSESIFYAHLPIFYTRTFKLLTIIHYLSLNHLANALYFFFFFFIIYFCLFICFGP